MFPESEELKLLLNLIEKQQKEIKDLKSTDLTIVYMDGFYDCKNRIKDKIKAKIEYYKKIDNAVGIRVLQALLEEENNVK